MGVRQSLFPMLTFGAPFSGAVSFPTPFSTASGVFGLVAGPFSAFRLLNFKCEAFQLASNWWSRHRPANQVETRL